MLVCLFATRVVSGAENPEEVKSNTVPSYATITQIAPREFDNLPLEKVTTEQQALRAFFKAEDLMAQSSYARTQGEATQLAAEAKRLTTLAAEYYGPDLQAMSVGYPPLHATANWRFLRELYRIGHWASRLSGDLFVPHYPLNDEAHDAWALGVLWEVTGETNEAKRRAYVAEMLPTLRESLKGVFEYEKLFQNVSQRLLKNSDGRTTPITLAQTQATPNANTHIASIKKAAELKESLSRNYWRSRLASHRQPTVKAVFCYGDPITTRQEIY